MNKKKIIKILLPSLILVVALLLRVLWLEQSPPSVNWDEAALGYNAYSLLKTGADEYGRKWPLTLRSFDDYKGAIYSYLAMPFIALGGLKATMVRLPSVLAGTGLVLLAFLLGKKLFNRKAGLGAMVAMAVSPVMILLSRTAFEANLALCLLMTGVYLTIREKDKRKLLIGYLLLVISMYTYHTEKIVAPLVILISLIEVYRREGRQEAVKLAIWPAIVGLPLVINLVWGGGSSRLIHTSIAKLWPFYPDYGWKHWLALPYYLGIELWGRVAAMFSPATLFVRGSSEPGQRLIETGILLLSLALPWLIGWYEVIRKKNKEVLRLMAVWLVITLISWNWFSLIRGLPAIFWHCLVIGVGIDKLIKKRKLLTIVLAGALVLETVQTTNAAWMSLPAYQDGDYQAGVEAMVEEVMKVEDKYDRIVIDSPQAQTYIFFLFYSKFDPAEEQRLSSQLSEEELKEHTRLGKFEFRQTAWLSDSQEPGLIVTNSINVSDEKIGQIEAAKLIGKTINKFGDEQYRLIEIN